MAYVACANSAENGIAEGVHQHVGIGMAFQAFGMRDIHAAKDEFAPFDQGVNVVAYPYANHRAILEGQLGATKIFVTPPAGG